MAKNLGVREFKELGIYGYKTVDDIKKSGDLIRAQIRGDCPKRSPVTGNSIPLMERKIDYATGVRRLNFLRISSYAKHNGKRATPVHIQDAFDEEMKSVQSLRAYAAPGAEEEKVCSIHGTPSTYGCSICEYEAAGGDITEMFGAKGYDKKFLAEYFGAFPKKEEEPFPTITFRPGVAMGKVFKTKKRMPKNVRKAVEDYVEAILAGTTSAVTLFSGRPRSGPVLPPWASVSTMRKSHRLADNALADLIEYSEGKRTLSDDEIQKVLDSQVYEWNFGEYVTKAEMYRSKEREVIAFAKLLDALGYDMEEGDVVKISSKDTDPMADPLYNPLLAPTVEEFEGRQGSEEWFGAEGEGEEEVPSEESQLSPEEAKAEKEVMKEEATFAKIAGPEIKQQRKELHRFAKTRVGANIMRKIEQEALKLVPGKYPGSQRYELKVTAQMLEWTEGRTEWDWSYRLTEDLGPAISIPRTDPKTGAEIMDPVTGRVKTKIHYPGLCSLCNHPIRYNWVFEQKDPATGKMVGVGVVCAHTQLGVPQDILARAYALVTKIAGIARRKTVNSELTAEFGPWLNDIATLDKSALVTYSRDTVDGILKKYAESGDPTFMLRNIMLWLEHDKSTTLRLTKDMLDSMRKLKDDPDYPAMLKERVIAAEARKKKEEEERELRWKGHDARLMGLDPSKYTTLAELKEAMRLKEEEDRKARETRERDRWVDIAEREGIDASLYPGLEALAEAVESARRGKESAEKESTRKFLETYGKANDYLGTLRDKLATGYPLSGDQLKAVTKIKGRFEAELAVHPEFAYALAHAETDYGLKSIVRSVSFGNSITADETDEIKAKMWPVAPPVVPTPKPVPGATVATGPAPKPSSWTDDEWEALQWFDRHEDAIRKEYPRNWMFKPDPKYGRAFIDSVRYFAKTDRRMSERMGNIFIENIEKLKERMS